MKRIIYAIFPLIAFLSIAATNVGVDWTNAFKDLFTTGNITGAVVRATTGFFYNNGQPNGVDRYVEDKLAEIKSDADYSSLANAVADIGSTPTVLRVCQQHTLANGETLTIPETLTLDFTCGGSIYGDGSGWGAEILTVNGEIIAGLDHQIFGTAYLTVNGSPKIDAVYPEWFGAKGDGVIDDTSAVQAMFSFPYTKYKFTKSYYITGNISIDLIGDFPFSAPTNIIIDAKSGQFIYSGTDYPFHIWQSSSPPNSNRLTWVGGWFEGTSSAAGCFKLDDVIASVFDNLMIRNFNNGIAFHIRNVIAWSEQNTFKNIKIAEVGRMFQFDPASVTGGIGTESFSRTSILNIKGGAAEYWIYNNGGGLYDSIFSGLYGNLGTQCKAVVYLSGAMGGTVISNIGVEQGDPTSSYIFELGTFTGSAPIVVNYHGQDIVGIFNGDQSILGGIMSPKIDTEGIYSTGSTGLGADLIDTLVNNADYGGIFQSNTSAGTDALSAYGNLILQPRTSQGRAVYIYAPHYGADNAPRAKVDFDGIHSYAGIEASTVISNSTISAIADGDAAPDVRTSNIFSTANTAVTYINEFTFGKISQKITVIFTDSNTTLRHNFATATYPIMLKSGVDTAVSANTAMSFIFDGSKWYEL